MNIKYHNASTKQPEPDKWQVPYKLFKSDFLLIQILLKMDLTEHSINDRLFTPSFLFYFFFAGGNISKILMFI